MLQAAASGKIRNVGASCHLAGAFHLLFANPLVDGCICLEFTVDLQIRAFFLCKLQRSAYLFDRFTGTAAAVCGIGQESTASLFAGYRLKGLAGSDSDAGMLLHCRLDADGSV